jgi:uncharacterized protein YkwD
VRTRHALVALTATAVILLPTAAEARGPSRAAKKARSAKPAARSAKTVSAPDVQASLIKLINRDRAAAGLAPLRPHPGAQRIAALWSRQMAAAGGLSHNGGYLSAATLQRLRATKVGENVAVAASVEQIHTLFMQSPLHRANILHPDFRQVGIAAFRLPNGRMYVTEDFLQTSDPAPRNAHKTPKKSMTRRTSRPAASSS